MNLGSTDPDNYFGLGTDLSGQLATFTFTIDLTTLGTPATTSDTAEWIWENPNANLYTGETDTSLTPIGISDSVTINGKTVTAGVDRQLLFLQDGVDGSDVLQIIANTELLGTYAGRDYVDLTAVTYQNPFLSSLDPVDLANLVLPSGCNDQIFNHLTDAETRTYASGSIGSIGGQCVPVPEPMTILIFGAGLLGLGALRRRKARKTA
jgi:hypothetical protein